MKKRKTNEGEGQRVWAALNGLTPEDQPPLIAGGQGRSAEDVRAAAGCIGLIVASFALWGLIPLVWLGCAS